MVALARFVGRHIVTWVLIAVHAHAQREVIRRHHVVCVFLVATRNAANSKGVDCCALYFSFDCQKHIGGGT